MGNCQRVQSGARFLFRIHAHTSTVVAPSAAIGVRKWVSSTWSVVVVSVA